MVPTRDIVLEAKVIFSTLLTLAIVYNREKLWLE